MANPRKLLAYVKQFLDPKFNPERRGALQMLAAAPVAGKLKMGDALKPGLDPMQFYQGLARVFQGSTSGEMPYLSADLWLRRDEKRSLGEEAQDSAFDNMLNGDGLSDALIEGREPFMYGDPDKWKRAVDTFHDIRDDAPDYDALQQAHDDALSDYLDSVDLSDVVSEFGHDDAYSDFWDGENARLIQEYVDAEAGRVGVKPDLLAKQMGLPQYLDKVDAINRADFDLDIDLSSVPDFYYKDPEALRYASLRQLTEHPVLSPQQLAEITGVPLDKMTNVIDEKYIAQQLYADLRPYHKFHPGDPFKSDIVPSELERSIDFERVPEATRRALLEELEKNITSPQYGWDSEDWKAALRGFRGRLSALDPDFMSVEDIPSYVTGRGPLRSVKYDSLDRGRLSVNQPLSYLDVVKALPPEEYSTGGRV